ncbi:MAG TPA: alpha/beta hydrolase [Gaiellaceae bacterium]|nr:alpha/beta hydrolase [Gaiellaceae bacterium]
MGVPAVRRGASQGRLGAARVPRAALPRVPGERALSTAPVNGTELAYDSAGNGPGILLLHAGVGDRRLWDGQTGPFADRHRVVRPDLRGFGETPLPGGPFSYVEDVRGLLDHLGIDRAALVANSFGGRVALDFTLAHPERVTALVLAAPAVTGWEGSPQLDAFDEEENTLLDAGRLDEAVELNLRTWLDGHGRAVAPVAPEARAALARMQRHAFDVQLRAYAGSPEPQPTGWSDPPAISRLSEVSAPTLVVSCTHDQPAFRELAGRLVEELPSGEAAVLDTGHVPAFERPEEFNRLALAFLAENAA